MLDGLAFERPAIVGDGGAARAFAAALPGARLFSRRGEWPPDLRDADLVVHATSARDERAVRVARGPDARRPAVPGERERRAAGAAGARVIDGLEVLVRQGAASFELWTGVPAPLDVMRNAVRSAP